MFSRQVGQLVLQATAGHGQAVPADLPCRVTVAQIQAGPEQLGTFSLFFPLVFIAIALQESLITAPYTVFAADHDGDARRRYLGSVLIHTLVLGGVLAVGIAIASL